MAPANADPDFKRGAIELLVLKSVSVGTDARVRDCKMDSGYDR